MNFASKCASGFQEASTLLGSIFSVRNVKNLLLGTLLLGMFSNWALGQDTATLLGTVTDPSGSVLPNVTVTITNPATGVTKTAPTNDVGQYVFPECSDRHLRT